MLLKYLLLATASAICISASCDDDTTPLRTEILWIGGSIDFPDKSVKALYRNSGRYINKNMLATRGQIYGDYAYVVLPRFKPGVAVTLAQLSLKPNTCEASLKPFPCVLTQEEGNCQALQSAVDVFLDAQDVLWVLDTGVVNSLDNPTRRCPPKVVGFSVKTGKLLRTIDLSGLVCEASRLQYITVEYDNSGKPYVYISDAATRSILVYDVIASRGYRVVLPKAVTSGCNKRDILYICLVRQGCGNNFLVFSYLCGKRAFSIRTDYLRGGSTQGNIVDLGPKPYKLVFLGTDLGSSIFVRVEGKNEVFRWDTNQALSAVNLLGVFQPDSPMVQSTHVMADTKLQRMRVLESNFVDYFYNTVGSGAVTKIDIISGGKGC